MAGGDTSLLELKQRIKAAWMAGDFGKLAPHIQQEAEAFVGRLELKPGVKVLDVGCGTGNQSIPAARAGAVVTGVDIASNLLEQAAKRAQEERLNNHFQEADVESLPFGDGEFDVVMSMFAAMFAPQPKVAATEMVRVCRRGGLIAMANWIPGSFIAERHEITSRYAPPPPGLASPSLWGVEAVVRERFGEAVTVSATKRTVVFDIPMSPGETNEHYSRHSGSTQMLIKKLDPQRRDALLKELLTQWTDRNRGGSTRTIVDSEYLEVHARRL
jgi:ubiquinone/menaquinone biosynthesis C-methylase UbiE